MSNWDVFHSDRLEVERNLTTAQVRAAWRQGALRGDDLIRPAGSTAVWTRLSEMPALLSAEADEGPPTAEYTANKPGAEPTLSALLDDGQDDRNQPDDEDVRLGAAGEATLSALVDDGDDDAESLSRFAVDPEDEPKTREIAPPAGRALGAPLGRTQPEPDPRRPAEGTSKKPFEEGALDLNLRPKEAQVDLGTLDDEEDEYDPEAEDEAAAEFTLTRGAADKIDELDLAAMVDVAFQLVLFFLVTATTVLYKTLDIPKPNPESPPGATVKSSSARTLDDLQADYILVDIDPSGGIKVDHDDAPNTMDGLAERLRFLKQDTGRLSMLLTAAAETPHRYAVVAYDAANEVGLRIAIAAPKAGADGGGAAPPAPPPTPPANAGGQ